MMYVILLVLYYLTVCSGKIRHYYLAAVELEWDYAPLGSNMVTNDTTISNNFIKNSNNRIGSIYRKIVFRQFTDNLFNTQISTPEWMGILGPLIRAEVGDEMNVHFKNLAYSSGRPFSVHPHGVLYSKDNEGAIYLDNTSGADKIDDGIMPGQNYTYIWKVTPEFGPTPADPSCIPWGYHSHVNSDKDIDTGLMGMLLTCKAGALNVDGTRKDYSKEYIVYMDIADENNAWMIQSNLMKCGDPAQCLQSPDMGFRQSNVMWHINGYVYGNLPGFEVNVDEKTMWYIMSLNTGIHSISFSGNTLIHRNHRVDTIPFLPSTFLSAEMIPANEGNWLLYSRVSENFQGGMAAFYKKDIWNYAPSGQDKFNGGRLLDNPKSKPFFEKGPTRIGGAYIKARYVEYTDGTFTKRVERSLEEEHLGLLGPPIVAEVGDDLVVVLRNNADRPFSFLPHGVVYQKSDEGFNYKDIESGKLTGKIVNPGGTETYTFSVPNMNAGPTVNDSPCITHTYQSAVNLVRDLNTGLFGPVVICKRGQLKNSFNQVNTRSWFFNHKHIYLALFTIDENLSWYIDENIRASAWSPQLVDKQDPMFQESNAMHSINGLLYGNLEGIDMCLNENIVWHLMDFGGTTDMHGLYIHGQTWVEFGNNIDSKGLLPGYSSTMWSKPDTVGTWALECRTNSHFETGMVTKYTVNQCNRREAVMGNTKIRRYHIGAVEVEWDYAPFKRSVTNGQPIDDTNQKGGVFVVDTDVLIGSIYKKAVYRLFSDASFKEEVPRTAAEDHLEIMGPYIKAEVGERIEVVFKNMAGKPLSIHPQGLQYSKSMEGANYFDDNGNVEPANSVDPGQTFTYKWTVPIRSGPGVNDPNCIGRMYYSSVDSVVDTYTGLFGPLVLCRSGILNENGQRTDVDKEFAVMFMVIDENKSFYFKENIQNNHMNAINGRLMGNLNGIVMDQNDKVVWYIMGLGSAEDYHPVHIHGQVFTRRSDRAHRSDVIEVFPSTSDTVEMLAVNPGQWILHCHFSKHNKNGMQLIYTVNPKP
ncbi:hypothetical protein LOTGIDRAFT_170648 [Lottia gigantea]|uniref:Plastocyanin-like domain-containing protein n=1 Tax=Lottia gigantea TaxID=225164 RepID=V4CQ27_LOTGI|nr:hypothetical protein LOTGIDRAFT_170648 [Lottia gigantea]ESP04555.1 hypothetical protein LOTGIDRAFT_170648 [Lottia gigantea]